MNGCKGLPKAQKWRNNGMKIIAMYLPQYYQTPINDQRFCPGYTEWYAVRQAIPYFEGHRQPRIPKDNNYYNLLNLETMIWQQKIARQYGVDGFCFYHYYFGSEKTALEKPAEIFLQHSDIDIEFCFCWANESWGQSGNRWSDKFANSESVDLIQTYGGKSQWILHYQYVSKFFKDDRYLKIDQKPIFLIYRPDDLIELSAMTDLWNNLAVSDGFAGVYFIGVNMNSSIHGINAVLYHAPNCAYYKKNTTVGYYNGVMVKDYETVWKNILALNHNGNQKAYYGGFVDFDNTPRYGNIHGMCMINNQIDVFEKYFGQLVLKNQQAHNEILWINAWNEWGEGNYLEPDQQVGCDYLKIVNDLCKKVKMKL